MGRGFYACAVSLQSTLRTSGMARSARATVRSSRCASSWSSLSRTRVTSTSSASGRAAAAGAAP